MSPSAPPAGPVAGATEGPASGGAVWTSIQLAKARVLIVDDDDEARAVAAAALRTAGMEVDEVNNGLEALKAFESTHPHIALLEVMTPFIDGYSTCRAMRDLPGGDEVAIVMMTDLEDLESLRFGYDAGATDFILKPLNAIILQHRIRYMLRAAAALDELRQSKQKIAHLADHDALTGLANRRALDAYMRRLTEEAGARSDAHGAVFLLDLDGFKRVNDTFGHSAGDELICEIGRRLTDSLAIGSDYSDPRRPLGRILARLGGDEFVFIDPRVRGEAEATALADRMLASLGSFELRGHSLTVTTSIGVSLVSEVGPDIERLLQCADAAMYDAKMNERNNARFYSRTLSDRSRARLEIETALRRPGILSQLELYYQPKVDITTTRVVGVEALLRWHHPERGLLGPSELIPVAEETGLIVGIGRWVLHTACAQLRAWRSTPWLSGVHVAVNVSARQFRDPHFFADVESALAVGGVDPRSLEVEIIEGTVMGDTHAARALLTRLRSKGVRVALDDFGTGYSALGYLRQFPIDTLKIDRSFVADLLNDEGCAAITSAIMAMANRLKLTVVAEGVETEGQLECLRGLGCDQVQGYFFSRPLPASEFEAWAHARSQRPTNQPPLASRPPAAPAILTR